MDNGNYEAAQHLISKTTFPENRSNNETCRYLYYTGKIKAIQLDYAESYQKLMQAIRKAPDTGAIGFRVQTQKLAIVVELLLGEIPNRSIFSNASTKNYLGAYYSLVQSVIRGNVADFQKVVNQNSEQFMKDNLYSLINRIHHNVLKTGLRRINASYSQINFEDIIKKLNLDTNTDIEFIIAKAIRDNVLNAKIDHNRKCLILKQSKNIYTTEEPQNAFKKRIEFCWTLNTLANKALQYPHVSNQYEVKDDKEEISAEELLKMVEDVDDYL